MPIFLMLLLGLAALVLCAGLGLMLGLRAITNEPADDAVLSFDPFAKARPVPSAGFLRWALHLRQATPKRLTSRRAANGRFRKVQR